MDRLNLYSPTPSSISHSHFPSDSLALQLARTVNAIFVCFSDDSDDDEVLDDEEPDLDTVMIQHNGAVNRIRVCVYIYTSSLVLLEGGREGIHHNGTINRVNTSSLLLREGGRDTVMIQCN